MLKRIALLIEKPKRGTCGKRPPLDGDLYNPMAPACPFAKNHDGKHAWETKRWRIREKGGQ